MQGNPKETGGRSDWMVEVDKGFQLKSPVMERIEVKLIRGYPGLTAQAPS